MLLKFYSGEKIDLRSRSYLAESQAAQAHNARSYYFLEILTRTFSETIYRRHLIFFYLRAGVSPDSRV